MSEEKQKKWLYEFFVKKTVEKKETEKSTNDKGEEVETTKTVKEEVKIPILINVPQISSNFIVTAGPRWNKKTPL